MIPVRSTLSIAVILAVGHSPSARPSRPQAPNYPVIIKDSLERRARAEREWRRMLDAYKAPQTPPDLYPITYTPRSLLGVSGGIRIAESKTDNGSDTLALREAVRRFLERWRDLTGADPKTMSLRNAVKSGDSERLTFRQADYPYPIADVSGVMVVVVSLDGRLTQLDDKFIPLVDMPPRPELDREAACKKVAGRTFVYSDVAGHEQRVQVTSRDEINATRLVVVPIEKADEIELHLAWEVIAGKSPSWTVFIDAITGEQLRAVQDVRT